jgi:hypothetical protein
MQKQCILIELGMSADPSNLTIRAGTGKSFRMALLEVEAAHDDDANVPDCIDVPPPPVAMAPEDFTCINF